jgi:hypothetical protein
MTETRTPGTAGKTSFLRAHPRAVAGVLIAGTVLAIAGFLWFRPDKLVVDTSVDEDFPPAAATTDAEQSRTILSSGTFRDLEHDTDGTASVIEAAAGKRYVRLEDFKTSSGPDVIVILSDTPATEDDWGAYDDGAFVALGPLKGNAGNQNYAIPADVDLSEYRSVVIWCRRFNVAFGAAPIGT